MMCKYKYKALFFINSLNGGGAETVVLTLAEELHNQGIDSVFVTLYPSNKDIDYIDEHCLNFVPPQSSLYSLLNMLTVKRQLRHNQIWQDFLREYEDTDFCLVTAHLPLSHKVCSYSPWVDDAIYVMHISQHMVPQSFKFIHGKIIKHFYNGKKVSCVSKGVRDELINQYGFSPKTTKAVYNPARIVKVNKKKMHNRPYIIMVGRLCKQKRQDIGIKLFHEGSFSKTHDLIILGEGPWRAKLEDLADENVILKGYQSNVYEWIANADMLLSTSATEGFGMVLVEALSLKVPVVSSNCNYGPNEILTEELAPFLNASIYNIEKALNGEYPPIVDKYIDKFKADNIIKRYMEYYD